VNYLPRNRFKYAYLRKAIVLVVILISGAIVFSFLDSTIIALISPLWKAENTISRNLRNGSSFFKAQRALLEENMELKEKLSSIETELAFLSKDKGEVDTLLELLGRRRDSSAILATVLIHPPQTPYDIIVIDVGSKESIILGSEVSLPEGPVLGIISEVFSSTAKVELFSTSGEETNAILERGGVPVTLVGLGGGNFRLDLPRDKEVEEGDRILSADVFSRLLAVVENISVSSTDSFKKVLAKSPANIFSLRFVFVTP
jgi:cell shape-determining protein MreC